MTSNTAEHLLCMVLAKTGPVEIDSRFIAMGLPEGSEFMSWENPVTLMLKLWVKIPGPIVEGVVISRGETRLIEGGSDDLK